MYGPEGTSRGVRLPRLPDNDVGGTFFGALAAAGAERLVDVGDVVFQGDGAGRAVLLADAAADATGVAHLPDLPPFLLGEAADHIRRVVRDQLNQVVGAGLDALAAGLAVLPADDRPSVYDMDCIKRAGLGAGPQPQAAVGAADQRRKRS